MSSNGSIPIIPNCSYGLGCKLPSNELLDRCIVSPCRQHVHITCSRNRDKRCPFHSTVISRDRLLALVPVGPGQQVSGFLQFQEAKYTRGAIKDSKSLASMSRRVQTRGGDPLLVIATPAAGDCCIISLLRGLVCDGYPLQKDVEADGVRALRLLLAGFIRDHNWPHEHIASPLTIDQCIHDTETIGGWCGEVAMVAMALSAGVSIKLWRYPNDNQSSSIIEPLMHDIINDGPNRLIIHMLQTRSPMSGRPEHCSHWSSLVLLPPEQKSSRQSLCFGPIIDTTHSDGISFNVYEWISDPNRSPPLRISPLDRVIMKAHGKNKPLTRTVFLLRRRQGSIEPALDGNDVQLLVPGQGKTPMVFKPWSAIDSIGAPLTISEKEDAKKQLALHIAEKASREEKSKQMKRKRSPPEKLEIVRPPKKPMKKKIKVIPSTTSAPVAAVPKRHLPPAPIAKKPLKAPVIKRPPVARSVPVIDIDQQDGPALMDHPTSTNINALIDEIKRLKSLIPSDPYHSPSLHPFTRDRLPPLPSSSLPPSAYEHARSMYMMFDQFLFTTQHIFRSLAYT